MRLAARFTAAATLLLCVVMVGWAWWSNRHVETHTWQQVKLDQREIALLVSETSGRIAASQGVAAALDWLGELEEARPRLHVTYLTASPEEIGKKGDFGLQEPIAGQLRRDGTVITYVRLPWAPAQPALLRIDYDVGRQNAALAELQRSQVLTAVALVLIFGVLTALLASMLTGRTLKPIARDAQGFEGGGRTVEQQGHSTQVVTQKAVGTYPAASPSGHIEDEVRMAQAKQLEHANRMAAVGKLAAGLIHDIGTPLNVISGRAMMISAGGVSEDEIKHNARVVAEQASRIATMIRRLLTFARPKSGAAQADDVLAIAREHIELLSPLTRKTKVSIQITPESESIGVPATTAAVRQIFNNLLTNAIQAMPDGGVVTVGTGRERLAPPEGGEPLEAAFFYVADQGVGISSEQQDHLFEPFYSTQPEHEGSGLGLPVTEALARAFGGWIQVDSEAGKGARFTVVFPEANGQ